MLAIQCPSCQHKNTPGERFCEFCGVPLDLKPCPNCGKVDLVTTRICSGCGEVFPHIALAPGGDADETIDSAGSAPGDGALPPRRRPTYTNTVQAPLPVNEPPPSRALPLILVAVVAGGIPLLWMNRDRMPLPKAWQVQSAHPESTSSLPAPTPVQAPAAAPPPAATKAEPSQEERDRERAAKQEPAEQKASAKQNGQASAPSGARQRDHARTGASAQAGAPPRECTEAVAALGLCERKPKRD